MWLQGALTDSHKQIPDKAQWSVPIITTPTVCIFYFSFIRLILVILNPI